MLAISSSSMPPPALGPGKSNVAVIFQGEVPVGEMFKGVHVIDGDEHDLRFLDPTPCIVGLKAKGQARKAIDNPMIVDGCLV